jgi:hypothetical protein
VRAALGERRARQRLAASFAPRSSWLRNMFSRPATQERDQVQQPSANPTAVLRTLTGDTHLVHPPITRPNDALIRAKALLVEAAYSEHLHEHLDEKVILDQMQRSDLTALCLSGGGIRSATFSLGVLQGLARRGILNGVDYLSTVSGGGYIGSWLSSWMRRHDHGAPGVFAELGNAASDPLRPEPKPVSNLRDYSNYLAPRFGAFSPDLWTLLATYARNVLLVWLIILPPLLAVLMIPRAFEWLLLMKPGSVPLFGGRVVLPASPSAWLWTGRVFLTLAMFALALIRPVGEYVPGKEKTISEIRKERRRIWWFIGFGFVATIALTMSWARFTSLQRTVPVPVPDPAHLVFVRALRLFLFANVLGSTIYLWRHYRALMRTDDPALNALSRTHSAWHWLRILITRPVLLPKVILELFGIASAATVAALILRLGAQKIFDQPASLPANIFGQPEYFTIFGPPLLLLALFIEATLLIGAVTIVSSDFEREWWARAAALMLLLGVGWMAITSVALIGPAIITQSPKILSALGGVSAIVSVAVGYRDKSSQKKATRPRVGLTPIAAIATIVTLSALSLLNGKIVTLVLRNGKVVERSPDATGPAPSRSNVVFHASLVAPAGYGLHLEQARSAPATAADQVLTAEPLTRTHIIILRKANWPALGIALLAAIVLSIIAGGLLDVNTYSMHSMYRNRLIRAYLGASRWIRRPDPFTGFDPQDNLQVHQLRPDYLWASSFEDFDRFLVALPSSKLWPILPGRVRTQISDYLAIPTEAKEQERENLYPVVFGTINQSMRTFDLETAQPAEETAETLRRNRAYIKDTFAFLKPPPRRPPLHIFNIALNLVAGDNLAWQQRKAESFTVSPLHSGSAATERLGFRDSAEYGGAKGISLGTALAISGAAVSPNMGYNSSGPVTFMMTLFNARLGWWLGNPGPVGDSTYGQKGPGFSLLPLFSEAFALTNDGNPYVFLSDGGHFENLGMYEMVRRRCRTIIVCDAGGDPKYAFGDLANAVRKIRVDFGIPIDFRTFFIGPDPASPEKPRDAAYCAVGRIHYDSVPIGRGEGQRPEGQLIYIKPAVYSDCPVDVVNYSREGKPFPQESTVDQFFDETQFESYRALGSHMIDVISNGDSGKMTPDRFCERAQAYLDGITQKAG